MALLVAERAIHDRRRGIVGWAIGIAAYVGLMVSVYPAVQNSELLRAVRNYPKELQAFFGGSASFDFATGAGYLNVELFSFVVPVWLAIVAIAQGAGALAGEEESGTLDLLLANPVTRRRVVLEKIAALALTVLALAGVVAVSVLIVGAFVNLGVGADRVVITSVGAALVAVFIGLVAMLTGAATGSKAVAIGVATAVFAASYLIVGLAGLVSWIEPLRVISPLYHANGTLPLRHGLPGNYSVLVALCLVTIAAVVAVFDRHDLA